MPFLRKEACPRCREQGKDNSGDNLVRYTNGSAFCFACRYLEKPTNYEPPVAKKPPKEVPKDLTLNFPKENLDWLKQYLSPDEIGDYFRYSPSLRRHVYQHEGYWEARSVNPTAEPKVLSHGSKPFILFGTGDPIVVVEDVVSAIKVSRVATALPLFGSHFPGDWMVRVAKLKPSKIVIWLDKDKTFECREYGAKMRTLVPICYSLTTQQDPKAQDTDDIRRLLGMDNG